MDPWSIGALEVSEGAYGCCKCLFVFLFVLACMFDVRARDLNVSCIERLI